MYEQNISHGSEGNTEAEGSINDRDMMGQIEAIDKSQAVISFEMDGTILSANANFLTTLGYSLDEIKGHHHSMFVEASYKNSAEYKQFWAELKAGTFQSAEYKRFGKNGKEVWIQASYNPILDEKGNAYRVIKFATDITEQKLKNADYEGKVDAICKSEAMIEFTPEGKILTANKNFLDTMGYSLEEIVGEHHRIFIETNFRKSEEYKNFWTALGRGDYQTGEYKRFGKNAKEVWIQATYNPIVDDDGRVLKVVKFATNVTERKLQSAEADGIVNALNKAQAVIEFDLEGNILGANDNFYQTMGYGAAETTGKHHSMFVEPSYAASAEYKDFWKSLRVGQLQVGLFSRTAKGGKEVWLEASYNPILDSEGHPFKVIKFATDVTEQQNAQVQVARLVDLASKGQLKERIDVSKFSGTTETFVQGVNNLLDAVSGPVQEVNRTMQALAEGDLTQRVEGAYEGDFQELQEAVNSSLSDLSGMVGGIRDSASDIAAASRDISQGNNDLSTRTERQAASLEETAASMEELASTMKNNAENAQLADQLSSDAKDRAQSGGSVVTDAIAAMDEINHASKKISDIIGVIDEIAFQTNLLALNAAVEAARAGEQGRGFAVVATEVRNLAQRSATAAKEIKVLISDSVEKVGEGSELVNQSGKVLSEIVASVVKVSDVIGEITLASNEQSAGIDQVNAAITDMDAVTQQNAALVEEAAAASESMSDKARGMQEQLEHFNTDENMAAQSGFHSTQMKAQSHMAQSRTIQ